MFARMTGTQWNDLSAIVGRTIFVAVRWFCSADSVEVLRLAQPDVSTRVAAYALNGRHVCSALVERGFLRDHVQIDGSFEENPRGSVVSDRKIAAAKHLVKHQQDLDRLRKGLSLSTAAQCIEIRLSKPRRKPAGYRTLFPKVSSRRSCNPSWSWQGSSLSHST